MSTKEKIPNLHFPTFGDFEVPHADSAHDIVNKLRDVIINGDVGLYRDVMGRMSSLDSAADAEAMFSSLNAEYIKECPNLELSPIAELIAVAATNAFPLGASDKTKKAILNDRVLETKRVIDKSGGADAMRHVQSKFWRDALHPQEAAEVLKYKPGSEHISKGKRLFLGTVAGSVSLSVVGNFEAAADSDTVAIETIDSSQKSGETKNSLQLDINKLEKNANYKELKSIIDTLNNDPELVSWYKELEDETGVAWQIFATLHVRETSLSRNNEKNGQGVFQHYGKNYGKNTNRTTKAEFIKQGKTTAEVYILGKMGQERYAKLSPDNLHLEVAHEAFFKYNGQADLYKRQANKLVSGKELPGRYGSPYVANRTTRADGSLDERFVAGKNWKQFRSDGGDVRGANDRPGAALVLEALLKTSGAKYTSDRQYDKLRGVESVYPPSVPTQIIDGVAYYSQRDPKWAGEGYNAVDKNMKPLQKGKTIETSGCGITVMANVLAFAGKSEMNIVDMSYDIQRMGGRSVIGGGTDRAVMVKYLKEEWGVGATLLPKDKTPEAAPNIIADRILDGLKNGKMYLLAGHDSKVMAERTTPYTGGGHYVLVYADAGDGKVMVRDSLQKQNPDKAWSLAELVKTPLLHTGNSIEVTLSGDSSPVAVDVSSEVSVSVAPSLEAAAKDQDSSSSLLVMGGLLLPYTVETSDKATSITDIPSDHAIAVQVSEAPAEPQSTIDASLTDSITLNASPVEATAEVVVEDTPTVALNLPGTDTTIVDSLTSRALINDEIWDKIAGNIAAAQAKGNTAHSKESGVMPSVMISSAKAVPVEVVAADEISFDSVGEAEDSKSIKVAGLMLPGMGDIHVEYAETVERGAQFEEVATTLPSKDAFSVSLITPDGAPAPERTESIKSSDNTTITAEVAQPNTISAVDSRFGLMLPGVMPEQAMPGVIEDGATSSDNLVAVSAEVKPTEGTSEAVQLNPSTEPTVVPTEPASLLVEPKKEEVAPVVESSQSPSVDPVAEVEATIVGKEENTKPKDEVTANPAEESKTVSAEKQPLKLKKNEIAQAQLDPSPDMSKVDPSYKGPISEKGYAIPFSLDRYATNPDDIISCYYDGYEKVSGIHTGVDFRTPVGVELRAIKGGRVVMVHDDILKVETDDGYGWNYQHMNKITVKEGDIILTGQVVGVSGVRNTKGPHLHLSIETPEGVSRVNSVTSRKQKKSAVYAETDDPFRDGYLLSPRQVIEWLEKTGN